MTMATANPRRMHATQFVSRLKTIGWFASLEFIVWPHPALLPTQ
jgi:hypothetical protein